MSPSHEEIRREFADKLKTLTCPHCAIAYTDFAAAWSEAWSAGRLETMEEFGREERDGPIMLKCEWCGERAVTSVYLEPPKPWRRA